MAVKITIIIDENIEDLSSSEIRREICDTLTLSPDRATVKVSKLTARQYKTLMES
jgi:hypothetical protein